MYHTFLKGGGGGGGVHPDFFEKLNFEISVDQQTRDHDQTFEGGSGLRVPTGARGTATPIFGQFLLNHLNKLKSALGCSTCSY